METNVASVTFPYFYYKVFWRRTRATLWAVLCGLALTAIIVPSFEPIPFLTPVRNWMILIAAIVVIFPHFAKRWNV